MSLLILQSYDYSFDMMVEDNDLDEVPMRKAKIHKIQSSPSKLIIFIGLIFFLFVVLQLGTFVNKG